MTAHGRQLTTVQTFTECTEARCPRCLTRSRGVVSAHSGGGPVTRIRCLSPSLMGTVMRRVSPSSECNEQSVLLVYLLCSSTTHIRRVYSLQMHDIHLRGPCYIALYNGNRGAEAIPVVRRATRCLTSCLSRGGLDVRTETSTPLFFGRRKRGLAHTKIACVLGGCYSTTQMRCPRLPLGMSPRILHRSGTVRVLRTNIGLMCVQSFLNRTRIRAARVCTGTSARVGHETVRATGVPVSPGLPS